MKKLLYSSIILLLFSFSVIVFQVSCQKEAIADIENTSLVQNKFLYYVWEDTNCQYWISNIDGTNNHPITISLPTGQSLTGDGKVTADGKKIIFCSNRNGKKYIFSANLDGSNVTLLREVSAIEVGILDTF